MTKDAYSLQEIRNDLVRELDTETALLNAWETVTFPAKKGGKPFTSMARNIKGATYSGSAAALNPTLTVYAHSRRAGYVHEYINLYNFPRYMKADDPRLEKRENIVASYYVYDLDDIKAAVVAQIAEKREYIAALNTQLEAAEAAYMAYKTAYEAASQALQEAAKADYYNGRPSELYYAIKNAVERHYR